MFMYTYFEVINIGKAGLFASLNQGSLKSPANKVQIATSIRVYFICVPSSRHAAAIVAVVAYLFCFQTEP